MDFSMASIPDVVATDEVQLVDSCCNNRTEHKTLELCVDPANGPGRWPPKHQGFTCPFFALLLTIPNENRPKMRAHVWHTCSMTKDNIPDTRGRQHP